MTCTEGDEVTVHAKYKDVEKTFSGSVNEVWASTNRFFSEVIPTYEMARRMLLSADLQELLKESEDIIAFSEDSPHLMIPRSKLTDNETLALQLLAIHLGNRLGIIEEGAATREELQAKLGKSSKITSTRLGELIKKEIAAKTLDGKYSITTFGIVQLRKDVLPRVRAKMGAQSSRNHFL